LLTELHYTTTLEDADSVSGLGTRTAFTFGNSANRVDLLDLTVGVHAEIAERTTCRVAGVVPLRRGDDRSFDSEVQVQLERRF